ncbi:unnamed protein product [Pieris macdunnoughi]|uniref:Uncharacterized protein n=1 Tax=Pieris macdunnoughi TaxID=345717 RepID=A0A821M6Z3_9NEOP|nr:unnamed protein product [Pieris macdunnoughi]
MTKYLIEFTTKISNPSSILKMRLLKQGMQSFALEAHRKNLTTIIFDWVP